MFTTWFKRTRRVRAVQTARAEHEIRVVEARSKRALARLQHERPVVEARLTHARRALEEIVEPEGITMARGFELVWLSILLVAALVLAVWANLWGLEIFEALSPYKKLVVAVSLPVIGLLGGAAIGNAIRMDANARHRRVYFGIGFTILFLAVIGSASINALRAVDSVALQETARASSDGGDIETAATLTEADERRRKVISILSMVTMVALGLGGELGAAYAFDQVIAIAAAVSTVGRLRRRVTKLEDRLIIIAGEEEEARHAPTVTASAMAIEVVETEERQERRPAAEPRALPAPPKVPSLARLAWQIAAAIVIVLAMVVGWVAIVNAATGTGCKTAVLLDVSTSNSPAAFPESLRAVERVFRAPCVAGEHHIVIIGIGETPFSQPPIFSTTAPADPGRYAEYRRAWERRVVAEWRAVAKRLAPAAEQSDVLSAIARAKLAVEGEAAEKRLVFVSDMRHVSGALNFENRIGDMDLTKLRVASGSLAGIDVWVFGVHTEKSSEAHWNALRAFWTAYFARAGATLKTFSADLRVAVK